jgi:hypothetical protein
MGWTRARRCVFLRRPAERPPARSACQIPRSSTSSKCSIMARLIARVYNWWNIFTRLAQPDRRLEAVTSRPLLLHAMGRLVTTGRRKIVWPAFLSSGSEERGLHPAVEGNQTLLLLTTQGGKGRRQEPFARAQRKRTALSADTSRTVSTANSTTCGKTPPNATASMKSGRTW